MGAHHLVPFPTAPPHLQLPLRSTKMLKLVVAAAVMLHVVASKPFTPRTSEDKAKSASKPMDVNVEVTVNGVKIPINLDKYENSMGQKGPWVTCYGIIC